MSYTVFGENYQARFSLPIKGKFQSTDFIKIDLSVHNSALSPDITDGKDGLHDYVFGEIEKAGAKCAFGGYAEKRKIYMRSGHFAENEAFRSIHLGIDFWMPGGTEIIAPLPGRVHSFADNDNPGDYGPTIILEHSIGNEKIHALYGHLSRTSLQGLREGQLINRGDTIASLGKPFENRDWPPHLHFQLIRHMEDRRGDYPGVCYEKDQKHYFQNCPDPLAFFSTTWNKYLLKSAP